jgi:hypothetical protein
MENDLHDMRDRVAKLEVSNAVDAVNHEGVDKRLSSIESTLQWLVRLIIGALILALVGFIVGGGVAI